MRSNSSYFLMTQNFSLHVLLTLVYISSESDMRSNSYYCSMTMHAFASSTSYDDIVGLDFICKNYYDGLNFYRIWHSEAILQKLAEIKRRKGMVTAFVAWIS